MALFDRANDNQPKLRALTWAGIGGLLGKHEVRSEKDGPLFSPTEYPDRAKRLNANVRALTLAIGDFDRGDVSPERVRANLVERKLAFWIYSTHSSTVDHPKFRAVVPMLQPVPSAQWSSVWPALVQELFLGAVDLGTRDCSRMFYLPSSPPGATPFTFHGEGKPFDWSTLQLSPTARRAPLTAPGDGSPISKGERRPKLVSIAGRLRHAGAGYDAILAEIQTVNEARCTEKLDRRDLERIASSVCKYAPGDRQINIPPDGVKAVSPWADKPGWEAEAEIPILTEVKRVESEDGGTREIKAAVEPAYEVYNQLVGTRGYRPFRLDTGEPRVAIPTAHGLVTLDPTDEGFADWVGYQEYTRIGRPVPRKRLMIVSTALAQRAIARDLPVERVVSLAIRLAARKPLGSYLDLCDSACRTVILGPDGWTVERVGMPIFDRPRHMKALPDPLPPGRGTTDLLWKYVLVAESDQILVLADLVQQLVFPDSAKVVSVLEGGDGVGKTATTRAYGDLLDPTRASTLPPPKKGEETKLEEAARNRFTVRIDNVSRISAEFSDLLCRLESGVGIAHRMLYTDRDESVSAACNKLFINGITATPTATDLLRRSLILMVKKPQDLGLRGLGESALLDARERDHPSMLGGLLDLAVSVAKFLRDRPPSTTPDTMVEYVRVGRALSNVLHGSSEKFDSAWRENSERQASGAMQDPRMAALVSYWRDRAVGSESVTSTTISGALTASCRSDFPDGVSPAQAGRLMARAIRLLNSKGIFVEKGMTDNVARYRRIPANTGTGVSTPSTPLPEQFYDRGIGSGVGSGVGMGYEAYPTSLAGVVASYPIRPGSRTPLPPTDVGSGVSGVDGVVLQHLHSGHAGGGPAAEHDPSSAMDAGGLADRIAFLEAKLADSTGGLTDNELRMMLVVEGCSPREAEASIGALYGSGTVRRTEYGVVLKDSHFAGPPRTGAEARRLAREGFNQGAREETSMADAPISISSPSLTQRGNADGVPVGPTTEPEDSRRKSQSHVDSDTET